MSVGLGILAWQGVLTAVALLRLDRDYSVDVLAGEQRLSLPLAKGRNTLTLAC